jgi:D-sedoheptulose 7-phosphate isomerase/D-glycero-D-manno-heptose 1,7-bisphosphate phosphatase
VRAARPGVLLDRDGTIIVDHGHVGSVDRVEFIPGAIGAIAALNRAGIPVAVVTNQAGVARGYYGIEDMQQVHKHLIVELAREDAHVDLWLSCPYHPDGIVEAFARISGDRKPEPGMALAAAQSLDLDLSRSWVIGDDVVDMELAGRVGATGLHVGPPDAPAAAVGAMTFPNLAAAVEVVIDRCAAVASRPRSVGQVAAPRFPAHPFDRAEAFCRAYAGELSRALDTVELAGVDRAARILADAYQRDSAVFACGNGGSASIANHLQCDHVKGVRNGTELTNRVYSLSTNVELLSAIANDLGYENVFEYQLQSQARHGDVLFAVSSSGRSPNIVRALEWARANGLHTISLTGFEGVPARQLADASIHVHSTNYGVIEDAHQAVMHLLAQYIRQSRMDPDAVALTTF